MRKSSSRTTGPRRNERGSASIKFIIVLVVVAVVAYMGVQYIPVAYKYSSYKGYMQKTVDTASVTGQGPDWVKKQLEASKDDYGVPQDAKITSTIQDGRIVASVKFTRPISLIPKIWTYDYSFDYPVKSTDLFMTK
ncbi:MAG: hypothetical protein DMF68_14970 [Acidobacteria bacterium]|nr:MAG: hypothetical protein DMF68_14970 [Acidobacteriota bacterium]